MLSEGEKNVRCRQLPLLRSGHTPWSGDVHDGRRLTASWPLYAPEVLEWMHLMHELHLMDMHYRTKYEQVRGRNIAGMDRDEVLTCMTWLIRAEQYGEGVIATALEDGSLERLCLRLRQVT